LNRVGVLLVNCRQWELTRKCIETLLESEGVEVLPALVDNNSPGPVPDWVYSIPSLRFQKLSSNLGFAAGTNASYSLVEDQGPDFLLILNNDTEVFPDSVRLLTEHLDTHPEAVMATPAIFYSEQPDLVWSAGGHQSALLTKVRQDYRTRNDLPDEPEACTFASGCAILMRTEDFLQVGKFDSDLFIYYEDNDLCLNAMQSGMEIHLVPGSRILHHVSVTVGGVLSPMVIYFTHRNRYIVGCRHLSPQKRYIFTLYYIAMTLAKTVLYPLRGTPGLIPWMWKATLHGLTGRSGVIPAGLLQDEEAE
jgi:GT2 family glycosyltransferase